MFDNINHDHPVLAIITNAAASIAPIALPSMGSIAGPASLPVHDTTQTHFAGGALADVTGNVGVLGVVTTVI